MSEPEKVSPEELVPTLGAIVFASDEPVEPADLARALGGLEVAQVLEALKRLEQSYADGEMGLQLEWIAGGVRLATRSEVGGWVRRFFREHNRTRLSPPALETLAIIAYRQPVTAPEIQAIRGKDPAAALKGLLDKKLIRSLGRKKVVGNPLLYGTTRVFLEHFGLNDLTDLPSIEEFEELVGVLDERQARLGFDDTAEAEAAADEGPSDDERAANRAPAQEADITGEGEIAAGPAQLDH